MSERGSGKTTRAMLAAPKDAVFVWVDHHFEYPRALAIRLGREDLKIVSPGWLEDMRWVGTTLTGLRLDPDARLTDRQWECWRGARTRVRLVGDLNDRS